MSWFFLVVSYSQCNVLTGHHCVLEIIWSVISWYLSYHLSFQKNMAVLNFFLCVYYQMTWKVYVFLFKAALATIFTHKIICFGNRSVALKLWNKGKYFILNSLSYHLLRTQITIDLLWSCNPIWSRFLRMQLTFIDW